MIRRRVADVDTPWRMPGRWPTPAFNRWICAGAMRQEQHPVELFGDVSAQDGFPNTRRDSD